MPLPNQPKKLKEKLENLSKSTSNLQFDQNLLPHEKLPEIIKKPEKENELERIVHELYYLKKIVKMIKQGATGYDLAYLVEKQKLIKRLINEKGILFYETFLEIGEEEFIEYPDKKITHYKNFKTIENTEKYFFILWLKNKIKKLQRKYLFYKQNLKPKQKKKEDNPEILICNNCGNIANNEGQKVCEKCGYILNPS